MYAIYDGSGFGMEPKYILDEWVFDSSFSDRFIVKKKYEVLLICIRMKGLL
jgi:hypothetical protein